LKIFSAVCIPLKNNHTSSQKKNEEAKTHWPSLWLVTGEEEAKRKRKRSKFEFFICYFKNVFQIYQSLDLMLGLQTIIFIKIYFKKNLNLNFFILN